MDRHTFLSGITLGTLAAPPSKIVVSRVIATLKDSLEPWRAYSLAELST